MAQPMLKDERFEGAPLVTVAMPIYNAGEYLHLAVLSIIRQTYTRWELLIIDDGSTDNALQSIADLNDSRIKIFQDGQNKGLATRLNECIDLAAGKYLARMDQDDVSYPERFFRQIQKLEENPDIDLVAVRAITIDETNQATGIFPSALGHDEICSRPWLGFHFPHPTWMGRIGWFRKHRYTEPGPYFCEDQELLTRSYRDSRLATLDEILFAYRVRSRVNWDKLAKTRRTMLNAQLSQFRKLKQWHWMLLAFAAFTLKSGSDSLKKMMGRPFQPKDEIKDRKILLQWKENLVGLAMSTANK